MARKINLLILALTGLFLIGYFLMVKRTLCFEDFLFLINTIFFAIIFFAILFTILRELIKKYKLREFICYFTFFGIVALYLLIRNFYITPYINKLIDSKRQYEPHIANKFMSYNVGRFAAQDKTNKTSSVKKKKKGVNPSFLRRMTSDGRPFGKDILEEEDIRERQRKLNELKNTLDESTYNKIETLYNKEQ